MSGSESALRELVAEALWESHHRTIAPNAGPWSNAAEIARRVYLTDADAVLTVVGRSNVRLLRGAPVNQASQTEGDRDDE